jgi:hypothetical protein
MQQSPYSNGTLLPCENAAGWLTALGVSAFAQTFLDDANIAAGRATLGIVNSTPASAAATGTAGTIAWDANFIYVCTATDTWKRVAIATW